MRLIAPQDAAFLLGETAAQPTHVAGLAVYELPPGADPDYVSRLTRAPRLASAPPGDQERHHSECSGAGVGHQDGATSRPVRSSTFISSGACRPDDAMDERHRHLFAVMMHL